MSDLSFGQFIKHKREQADQTARHVALEAGLSASYVSKVEADQMKPSLKAFAALVEVLDCTNLEIVFLVRLANEE